MIQTDVNDIFDGTDSDQLQVDTRSSDRILDNLYSSGYKDGYQLKMDDENLMQRAFAYTYALFSKIGFLIGYIKAIHDLNSVKSAGVLEKLQEIQEVLINYEYGPLVANGTLTDFVELANAFNKVLSEFKSEMCLHVDTGRFCPSDLEGKIEILTSHLKKL